MSTASKDCIHLANIARVLEENISESRGITICCDNQPCITQTLDEHFRTKLRSIAVSYHIVKDFCRDKLINPIKVATDSNVADILTKRVVTDKKFMELAEMLLSAGGSKDNKLMLFEHGFGFGHDQPLIQLLI